jgi:hypothetical protein
VSIGTEATGGGNQQKHGPCLSSRAIGISEFRLRPRGGIENRLKNRYLLTGEEPPLKSWDLIETEPRRTNAGTLDLAGALLEQTLSVVDQKHEKNRG